MDTLCGSVHKKVHSVLNKKKIPVFVCEFHQDVLQHIHRSIARKLLPFTGLKMVHFDSHPDLGFPWHLLADDCFNKERMYSDLEIADWILPLIYAGHLSELTWVKPPWADQITNMTENVHVGERLHNKKMGVTCKENYFLEDCTYTPVTQLQKAKTFLFNSVDLLSLAVSALHHTESVDKLRTNGIMQAKVTDGDKVDEYQHTTTDNLRAGLPAGLPKKAKLMDDSLDILTERNFIQNHPNGKYSESVTSVNSTNHSLGRNIAMKDPSAVNEERPSNYERSTLPVSADTNEEKPSSNERLTLPVSAEGFVLDIDLDFFSVQNPFRSDYSELEYSELKEIYHLQFPADKSNEEELFVSVRAAERRIDLLLSTTRHFHQIQASRSSSGLILASNSSDLPEFDLPLVQLVSRIQQRKGKELDADDLELIHNAGMSSDLPHHVSSEEELDDLLEKMKTFLVSLPTPTVITMARSVVDEYCPPEQIDEIQTKTISVLTDLYGSSLDVRLLYEDDA